VSAGTALRFLTYAPGRIGAGKVTHRSEHWRATLPCPMPLERQRRYGRSHPADIGCRVVVGLSATIGRKIRLLLALELGERR
jgi:hypothetical protein